MKAILFPILLAGSAAGGVMSADVLRGDDPAMTHSAAAKADDHGATDKGHGAKDDKGHGGDEAKKDDKGHGGATDSSGSTDFINFKRQFVVPVIKEDAVGSLILLNLGLEVPGGMRDEVFRLEPRFRDAFIRELLQLSDDGYFDEALTSPETYEVVRETLQRAAQNISKEGVTGVLILDMTRQDR